MITSLSTQGGRINPQTMGATGPSPVDGLWARGSAPAVLFNPYWAANSNTFINAIYPAVVPK